MLIDIHYRGPGTSVLNRNGILYSCMLNQTDIKANANKFYLMQLLQVSDSQCDLYIRYGRIGEVGKISRSSPAGIKDIASGIRAFCAQFKSKTGNEWANKDTFVEKNNKYFLSTQADDIKIIKQVIQEEEEREEEDLDPLVIKFIELITDLNMIKRSMVQLDIDTEKMPLGKINEKQLDKAKNILLQLKKLITASESDPDEIRDLSSKYYRYVPHACRRGKRLPTIIQLEQIDKHLETIDELKNISVTAHLTELRKPKMNSLYLKLDAEIRPLSKQAPIYRLIEKFLINSHAPTHYFKLTLLDILEIDRKSDVGWKPKHQNVQLLVHGSRMANWVSIIKNGLVLDPGRMGVFISGKMFGYGVYFANSFSKSAQYCGADYGETICFVLAEVSLGNQYELYQADPNLDLTKISRKGCNSVWGKGRMSPVSYDDHNGVKIPTGKLQTGCDKAVLNYDEMIVYDTSQIRLKYMVMTRLSQI